MAPTPWSTPPHKPHVGTRSRQDFVDANVTGTPVLLEERSRRA